ncbi:MAG: hypothetical protein K9G26_01100 [Emcibacter sp.]|nr:hypothetical protein [Emcibacter sp.]
MMLIHGTGVFFEGKGLLIRGPSGSGKSDLALRLLALGGELIGDDYVEVSSKGKGCAIMAAPKNIEGMIEVRSVGILKVPFRPKADIHLILDLVARNDHVHLERLPEGKTVILETVQIPCLDFYAFEPSAPEKIRAALKILL